MEGGKRRRKDGRGERGAARGSFDAQVIYTPSSYKQTLASSISLSFSFSFPTPGSISGPFQFHSFPIPLFPFFSVAIFIGFLGALSLLPLSISSLLKPHQSLPKTHFSNQIFSSKLSPIKLSHTHFSHESALRSSKNDTSESRFLDDDGVVDDMDSYLNYLSLEYDSVWVTRPSWCQPWTISLTGVLVITSSWLFVHSVVVTMIVLTLICAWWFIFLYAYPKAYSDMIAER